MRFLRSLSAGLVAAILGGSPLLGQSVGGSVSVTGAEETLPGARVVLLTGSDSTVASTRTNSEGRFHIDTRRSGRFRLLVDRPGYLNQLSNDFLLLVGDTIHMDVEVDPRPVEMLFDPTELDQALTRRVQRRCGRMPDGSLAPSLVGLVTDARSGVVLPGVRITLEWSTRSEGARLVQMWTDAGGVYALCDPPRGGHPRVRAETLGLSGDPIEVEMPLPRVARVDLALPLTKEGAVGHVMGRVVDHRTDEALSTVDVRIRGIDRWTLSDRNGYFRFDSVPPGIHVLEVDRVGYASLEKPFRVVGRAGHQVDVALSEEAIPLEPITVSVRSRRWFADMEGLQRRMASGIGDFFTRSELLGRGVTRLTDILHAVPGFVVRRVGRYAGVLHRAGHCAPSLYLDGRPHRPDPVSGFDAVRVFDLEAVEIYDRNAETPAEFLRPGVCGAVVAWTRRGR